MCSDKDDPKSDDKDTDLDNEIPAKTPRDIQLLEGQKPEKPKKDE